MCQQFKAFLAASIFCFVFMFSQCAAQVESDKGLPFVLDSAEGVFVFRVNEIMNHSQVKNVFDNDDKSIKQFERRIKNVLLDLAWIEPDVIDSLVLAIGSYDVDGAIKPFSMVVVRTAEDNEAGFDKVLELARKSRNHNGQEYHEFSDKKSNKMKFVFVPNKKTIVFSSDEGSITRAINSGKMGPSNSSWYGRWKKQSEKHFSMVLIGNSLKRLQRVIPRNNLFDQAKIAVAGVELGNSQKIELSTEFEKAADMKEFVSRLQALSKLASQSLRDQLRVEKDKESVTAIESGIAAIDSVKYQQNSMTAIITADAKIDLSDLLPVFKETENRFRVSTSISNARLVSQSLQAFEAETGKVPSSVMISEHGKEYSWRIAILPFIGHQYIYDRYRFDEAWNSPNNLKVTESMPDFFGHPDDPKDSTNSRMFFVVGNGTMFKNSLHSKSTSEIADGASDTIMAVQAKRDIHWAKPQDIEFDPTNLNFGGFGGDSYTVTLADGSVQRISQNADQEELTKALTPDGGEAIDSSKLFSGQK